MKQVRLSVILSILAVTGIAQCSFSDNAAAQSYLSGGWRLERRCGGIAGLCQTPLQLGYSQQLRFTVLGSGDSIAYIYYKNFTQQSSGRSRVSLETGQEWQLSPLHLFAQHDLHIFHCQADTLMLSEDEVMDGYFYVFSRDQTVSLSKNGTSAVSLYPSPAGEYIVCPELKTATMVKVFDVTGRIVLSLRGPDIGTRLDIGSLSDGHYLLEIRNQESSRFGKFVKRTF